MFLVAALLAPAFLSLVPEEPKITVTVNRIEVGTDYGKPPGTPGGGKPDKPDKTDGGKPGDYKLMGVKWYVDDLPLTLYVGDGLDEIVIGESAEEWDSYTVSDLVFTVTTGVNVEIFDELPLYTGHPGNPDGQNELIMASPEYFDSGVIAVCYTWYSGDRIIQFDIAFNNYYNWGDADLDDDGEGNPNVMDLQNIATHEFGHGFGLADIYKRKLSALTMYGYSGYGDVAKRTLEQGDIEGIQTLYGVPP